jgi:hypothetical protein
LLKDAPGRSKNKLKKFSMLFFRQNTLICFGCCLAY